MRSKNKMQMITKNSNNQKRNKNFTRKNVNLIPITAESTVNDTNLIYSLIIITINTNFIMNKCIRSVRSVYQFLSDYLSKFTLLTGLCLSIYPSRKRKSWHLVSRKCLTNNLIDKIWAGIDFGVQALYLALWIPQYFSHFVAKERFLDFKTFSQSELHFNRWGLFLFIIVIENVVLNILFKSKNTSLSGFFRHKKLFLLMRERFIFG